MRRVGPVPPCSHSLPLCLILIKSQQKNPKIIGDAFVFNHDTALYLQASEGKGFEEEEKTKDQISHCCPYTVVTVRLGV